MYFAVTTSKTPTATRATTTTAGLRRTPLTPEMAPAWSHLHAIIADDDGGKWKPTPTELAEELQPSSTFDPAQQTWAVWSGEEMIAFALAGVRSAPRYDGTNSAFIIGGVHPDWRGHGLGSELLERTERRGAERARALVPGVPLVFNAMTTATAPAASEFLTDHGYEQVRYWFDMTHDLQGDFTDDPRTQPLSPEHSEAVRLAHNDAFSTHWGSAPISAENWHRLTRSAGLRPDLSRIVVEDGEVLAYTLVSSNLPGEAYFDLVGVRGGAQGRGLGRAVLTSGLAAIRAEGSFTEAGLDVDADNPSGAGHLYTSAGFTNTAKTITWEKPR